MTEAMYELAAAELGSLVEELKRRGYRVIGPTVVDNAIVLTDLDSADDLPWGWGVRLDAGSYRLLRRDDKAAFGHTAGPQSWKRFLHPPRELQWAADRADGFRPTAPASTRPRERLAFLGVRPCDLRAIQILDRVLTGGSHTDAGYQNRRSDLFIVAAECTEPGATCFCASMGTGPAADSGFDLAIVEEPGDAHRFIVRTGSAAGVDVVEHLPVRPATDGAAATARAAVEAAKDRMGRAMPDVDLRQTLVDARTSSRWDDIATRCLSCANCTLVCPTCFCTTTEETTDLTGDHTERWQRWDSCFDLTFTYVHGVGSTRDSTQSRYRHWISHKLSTWHDQFGSSGCVGCGRCIAWCPAGIDITAEVAELVEEQP